MKIDTVNVEAFEKELKNLGKDDVIKKIEELYQVYKLLDSDNEIQFDNIQSQIEEILEILFKNQYSNELMIPYSFLNSEIGKVLFTIKYSNTEKVFTSSEVAEMLGCSLQYIAKLVKEGKLKGQKKSGRNYFFESDVVKFMENKER
ncbi:helix-turn-helix domain-containing protein [Clostridium sp.]|uniref:helix-turn-helix domain-containing protein n=1 Tax=Clostridium sp. TaxID=1506 RepID=UPI003F2D102F